MFMQNDNKKAETRRSSKNRRGLLSKQIQQFEAPEIDKRLTQRDFLNIFWAVEGYWEKKFLMPFPYVEESDK